MARKRYNISDGKLVLTLELGDEKWWVVTSPTDPAMITQARTIPEAFLMARDAFALLAESRGDKDRWKKTASSLRKRKSRQRAVGVGS